MIAARDTPVIHVSAVSVWEIANKNRMGKLDADATDFASDAICRRLIARERLSLPLEPDGRLMPLRRCLSAGGLTAIHSIDLSRRSGAGRGYDRAHERSRKSPAFGCKVLW